MAHSAINKKLMLAWIEDCHERSLPMPTDEQIAERFILSGIESARTLLADLADAGQITIRFVDEGRRITLGRSGKAAIAPAKASPSIKTADKSVDRAVAKILAAIGKPSSVADQVKAEALASSTRRIKAAGTGTTIRHFDHVPIEEEEYPGVSDTARKALGVSSSGDTTRIEDRTPPQQAPEPPRKAPVPPQSEMPERPEVETVEAQQDDPTDGHRLPASVDQGPRPERPPSQAAEETIAPVDASPQSVEARQPDLSSPPRPNVRGERIAIDERKQINIRVPAGVYDAVEQFANDRDLSITRAGQRLLEEALKARQRASEPPTDADVAKALRSLVRRERDAAAVLDFAASVLAPDLVPTGKPRISIAVQRAWQEDGRPFHEFLTAMLEHGVDEWRRFRAERVA